jgi:FAD/FMN-containing dehydrogenase
MTDAAVLDALSAALPAVSLAIGEDIEPKYLSDWSGIAIESPLALVRPASVEEVSTALAICNRYGQAVTPQGGRTGLNGSAAPRRGEIVLSMDRFTGIEELDRTAGTMLVRAGTTLETIQAAADEAGWLVALDLGARGSCQIGGNISTNAGGNRVVRYGVTRAMVLGLEAVLADGSVISGLQPMIKNNAGYDLKQLFIGSEGTLGVVTRARLRLHPRPVARITALISADSFEDVTTLLRQTGAGLDGTLSSFEVMWQSFYRYIAEGCFDGKAPMPIDRPLYTLIETHCGEEERGREQMEAFLASMLEDGVIGDALIAQSEREADGLWAIRDMTGELTHLMADHMAFDIGVPLASMNAFVESCRARLATVIGDNAQVYYGHLGDSNLHLNVDASGVSVDGQGRDAHRQVDDAVYDEVRRFAGTITAEHGVGFFKRRYLGYCRSQAEIATMRLVKQALDPNGILNPGRIFT